MLLEQYPEMSSQEIDDKMAMWLGQQPEHMNPFLTMKGTYTCVFLILKLSDIATGFVHWQALILTSIHQWSLYTQFCLALSNIYGPKPVYI